MNPVIGCETAQKRPARGLLKITEEEKLLFDLLLKADQYARLETATCSKFDV